MNKVINEDEAFEDLELSIIDAHTKMHDSYAAIDFDSAFYYENELKKYTTWIQDFTSTRGYKVSNPAVSIVKI